MADEGGFEDEVYSTKPFEKVFRDYPVKITSEEGRGRFAIATRDIEAGEILLKERAWASCSGVNHKHQTCHNCMNFEANGYKYSCPQCRAVFFCSPQCFKLSMNEGQRVSQGPSLRPHYKTECDALARFHASVLKKFKQEDLEQIRLLIQIVSLRYHEAQKRIQQKSGKQPLSPTPEEDDIIRASWAQFLALASNKSSFPSSKLKMIRLRATAVLNAYTDPSNKKTPPIADLNVEQVMGFIARVESNSFSRAFASKRRITDYGVAVYNCAAMFNHSCFPTVARAYEQQDMIYRALCPIKKGQELTITYVPLQWDTNARKEELNNYCFDCWCPRCSDLKGTIDQFMNDHYFCENPKRNCEGLMVIDGPIESEEEDDEEETQEIEGEEGNTKEEEQGGEEKEKEEGNEGEKEPVDGDGGNVEVIKLQRCLTCYWTRPKEIASLDGALRFYE